MRYGMIFTNCALTLTLLASVAALAAEPESEPATDPGTLTQVLEMYETAKQAGEQVPRDVYEWAKQDLGKIGDWEYLVTEISMLDSNAVQERLNKLGSDRWECIWIHTSGGKTSFVLKRPAKSYLKNVPLSQLMKFVPRGESNGE